MAHKPVFVIISLILMFFYFMGLVRFLGDVGEDKCEMTYMFEYPQFIRISNKIDKKYPKYGLYAYGEGRLTAKVRNMDFDGIPVLFIPGNAGSYKQVRSLSSVALRKAISDNTPFHFDYFTVDLNDEFSGLYGALLYDQLSYVNNSFHRIFELYKRDKPKSIILIGHSMGGVIARRLLLQLPESNMVSILITLASPLRRAPLILDQHLRTFYDMPYEDSTITTTVINLSGGYRDFLIPTILSKVKNVSHLDIVTSNVPMTWIENNHVQILWCKQLILGISRALFDSVDPDTKFISPNSTFRDIVFNHHLNWHSGIKIKNLAYYSEVVNVNFKGKWIENLAKQYTVEHMDGVREPHWYMVKLTPLPGHDILNVLALNLESVNWVYVCNAKYQKGPSRICKEAYHLTHLSEIAPSLKYKRRMFRVNLRELYKKNTEFTHVVFKTLPTDEPIVFHVDVHSLNERTVIADLPDWWNFQKQVVIDSTPEKALDLQISLPKLQHIIQYYNFFIEPLQCSNDNHHASVSLITPWSRENRHYFITSTGNKPFDLRLYSPKPKNFEWFPYVKLILDPSCMYQISVQSSFRGILGQLARFYTPLLLCNIAVVVLLALKHQISSLKKGSWPSVFTAIMQGPRGYYLLPLARIFTPTWPTTSLPQPDIWYIIDDGLDFVVITFLLYICSVGIVWILSVLYAVSLFTLESTANKWALKLLTKTFVWSNYFMTFLHKVPVVVAGILLFISLTTCGSLALCLGAGFYFLKLTQMSQDYVEDVLWFIVKKFGWNVLKFFKIKQRQNSTAENEIGNVRIVDENQDGETEDFSQKEETGKNVAELTKEVKSEDAETQTVIPSEDEIASGNDCKFEELAESGGEALEGIPEDDTRAPEISDEGEVPEVTPQAEQTSPSTYNSIFFHSTIFYLWCIVSLINIPAVLTWAHNFKFYKSLSPDDSFWPGVALSLCAFPLWQFQFPRVKKKGLDALNLIITIIILLCLIFATVSLYRLNYLLTFVIVAVTLHQLLAPLERTDQEQNDCNDKNDDLQEKYEAIKKKM